MENQQRTVRLTLESIKQLFGKQDPSVEVLSIDESPGSDRGDNYTSMLYRLTLKGRKKMEHDIYKPWELAIIYKVLPESKERREAFKSELLFRNEVAFYTKVWPVLNELQAKGEKVFNGVAKVYIAKDDLIVMEDLQVCGFKMADRKKGLEVEKLKHVLEALAGFHALSLTLKELRPEVFSKLSNRDTGGVEEALFRQENQEWYRQYYRVAATNAIKMVTEGLPKSMEERRRDEILAKFKAFLNEDVFFQTMCQLTSTQGPLSVFCHGDCWTNNFLFKEDSNNPEAVYLVDFQLIRVGSLALDLTNLLYCCTSGKIRQVYMPQLLQHYHHHLMSALYILNPLSKSSKDSSVMWTLLTEEMRRCGRFGLGLALDILPISTCTSDQAPDLYEEKEAVIEKHTSRAPPAGGAECSRLMTDLVTELVHCCAL